MKRIFNFLKYIYKIREPCLINVVGCSPLNKQYCKINLLSYPAPLCAITVLVFFKPFSFLLSSSENNQLQNAETILRDLFELVPHDSPQELECYFINLELFLRQNNQIKDLIEIIFDHKEFNLDCFEDLIILSSNNKIFDFLLEICFLCLTHNTQADQKNNQNPIH
jgi:hypothetical protein